jgi:hypothetical protein
VPGARRWLLGAEFPPLKMEAKEVSRDECMARNVKWILAHASIGALAMDQQFGPANLRDWFDAVIFSTRPPPLAPHKSGWARTNIHKFMNHFQTGGPQIQLEI